MTRQLVPHWQRGGVGMRLLGMLVLLLGGLSVPTAQADGPFSQFTVVPNATVTPDGRLQLTSADAEQAGAAWLLDKQDVQGAFAATFEFQISELQFGGSDGFAFVLQNNGPSSIGDYGGGLGYQGIPNSVAVEFDTHLNPEGDFPSGQADPSENHLSIQTRGTEPNSADPADSLGSASNIADLSDGAPHWVTVLYVPGTLKVFMDGSATETLSVPLDLAQLLNLDNGTAWMGFTAGTGGGSEIHEIRSFFLGNVADLSVKNVANKERAKLGEQVVNTITVTNHGPETATDFVVSTNVTDQLNVVSVDCGQGSQPGQVFCPFASLLPGASVNITAVSTPCCLPRGESREARIGASFSFDPVYSTIDPNPSNDWAEVTLKIIGAHSR